MKFSGHILKLKDLRYMPLNKVHMQRSQGPTILYFLLVSSFLAIMISLIGKRDDAYV